MESPHHDIVRRGEAENRKLFGPFFLGIIICYFLWGIQITQSYYYYISYRLTDRKWLKGGVALLFIIDAVQSVCAAEGTWRYMVEEWGFTGNFADIRSWGVNVLPLTDSITTSLVHAFYAHKIFSLYKAPFSYIWTAIVVALSALQLAGGTGASIFLLAIHSDIATVSRAKTWVIIWLSVASLNDVIIAALMFIKLSQSRTGFKRSNDAISKLIVLTVETGMVTAVIQVADIVLYLGWPTAAFHALPAIISPKVYSNSILALLNSRPVQAQNSVSMWASQPDKSAEIIQIRAHQSMHAISDYELNKFKTGLNNSRSPDATPRLDSFNEFPPRDKGHA